MAAPILVKSNHKVLTVFMRSSPFISRHLTLSCVKTAAKTNEDQDDKPIRFSTSNAANYVAREERMNAGRTNRPNAEPLIIGVSTIAFLIYFCVLREENDIDEGLGMGLYDRVPDLQLTQLRMKRANFMKGGPPLTDEESIKLLELEAMPV